MINEQTNGRELLRRFIEDKIRETAYLRYSARTSVDSALDDWLYAESEVLNGFGDVRELWSRMVGTESEARKAKIAS